MFGNFHSAETTNLNIIQVDIWLSPQIWTGNSAYVHACTWLWNEGIYGIILYEGNMNWRISGVILLIVYTGGTSGRGWWEFYYCSEMWYLWYLLENPCWPTLTDLCVCRCCLCVGSWTRCSRVSRKKPRSLRPAWRQWIPAWTRLCTRWVLTCWEFL